MATGADLYTQTPDRLGVDKDAKTQEKENHTRAFTNYTDSTPLSMSSHTLISAEDWGLLLAVAEDGGPRQPEEAAYRAATIRTAACMRRGSR